MTEISSLPALEGAPHANVFSESEPKTIRLTLAAGEDVAPHTHPDRQIVFSLIEGQMEVQLGDAMYDLDAGDVARFDGNQKISPKAVEDSIALIVLARRPDH